MLFQFRKFNFQSAGVLRGRGLWSMSLATVILVYCSANQFSGDWNKFRSVESDPLSGDFPHYYIAAKFAGMGKQHPLYYIPSSSKEAGLGKIAPDTEWNNLARNLGLRDTLHFSSTPELAILLVPLGKLPFSKAYLVWSVFSELCMFSAICISLMLYRAFTPLALVLCTISIFAFSPVSLTFEKGQFGTILLLLWVSGAYFANKGKTVASALMFALATIVKITPVLAIGIFVFRRRWKWLGAYVGWMLLLVTLGIAWSGMQNHRLFLLTLRSLSTGVPGPYNYSLNGIIQNVFYGNILNYKQIPNETPLQLQYATKFISAFCYLAILFLLWKRSRDIVFDLTVASLMVLLVPPFTLRHYYVLETLPLIYVWLSLKDAHLLGKRWMLAGVSICTLLPATRYLDYLQNHLSSGPIRVLLVSLVPLSTLLLTAIMLQRGPIPLIGRKATTVEPFPLETATISA
jgi:hypothetical protein